MNFFKKRQKPEYKEYDLSVWEPCLRCSICTGEQTACMRNRETGRREEIMLIRNRQDLENFCRNYHVEPEKIRKEY